MLDFKDLDRDPKSAFSVLRMRKLRIESFKFDPRLAKRQVIFWNGVLASAPFATFKHHRTLCSFTFTVTAIERTESCYLGKSWLS